MDLFLSGVSVIIAGGIVSFALPSAVRGMCTFISVLGGSAMCAVPAVRSICTGVNISTTLPLSYPYGDVSLLIDPLSAFFVILICVGGTLSALYGIGYRAPYEAGGGSAPFSHSFFFGLMIGSMLLVVASQHAMFFLVAWETMSLSSLFLVLYEREKKEVRDAALFYAVAMHVCVVFLLMGFVILSVKGGDFRFGSFAAVMRGHGSAAKTACVLLGIGFGVKAGFIPVHGWLPRAHPAAPSHVSALMSGVMIKIGIYGILRLIFLYGAPGYGVSCAVIIISLATALFGIINAVTASDMKKLLAFSSIENIGIIGTGIGFGMLALSRNLPVVALLCFGGALFHVFNHMLFKGLLFYTAGAVYQKTHTRDMNRLGGLVTRMPITAFCAICGVVAITAVPPGNGFAGEFVLINGMLSILPKVGISSGVIAIGSIACIGLISAMALIAFAKFFTIPFLGSPRSDDTAHASEPSRFMIAAMILVTGCVFLTGLFPHLVFGHISRIAGFVASGGSFSSVPIDDGMTVSLSRLSTAGIVFFVIACGTFALRKFLLRGRSVSRAVTWGCGYKGDVSRAQYTAHSFSQPFVFIMGIISGLKSARELPSGFFPKAARFTAKGIDTVEQTMMKPFIRASARILERAYDLQTSRIQIYILYGFIFLIAALIYTMAWGD